MMRYGGQLHDDSDRRVAGRFLGPFDYEILSVAIEVALPEWGWIERIEDLGQRIHPDRNLVRMRRRFVCK